MKYAINVCIIGKIEGQMPWKLYDLFSKHHYLLWYCPDRYVWTYR